jgi:hypothetical protein
MMKKENRGGKRPNAGRKPSENRDKVKTDRICFRVEPHYLKMLRGVDKSFLCNQGLEIMLPLCGRWNDDTKKWERWGIDGTDANLIAYNAIGAAIQQLEIERDKNGIDADEAWAEQQKSLHGLLNGFWEQLRAHKTFWERPLKENEY